MTNDKENSAELGTINNPIGPSPEEAAFKWKEKIDPNKHRVEQLLKDVNELLPALEVTDKLGNHTTGMMMAVKLMQKRSAEDGKVAALINRLRPSLALKEDLDVYISDRCEEILNDLERGVYDKKQRPLLP